MFPTVRLSCSGVDPDALAAAEERKKREQERIAQMQQKMPATLGSIEVGERRGFVVDPRTGEKRYTTR